MTLWNLPRSPTRRRPKRNESANDWKRNVQSKPQSTTANDKRISADLSTQGSHSNARLTTTGSTSLVLSLPPRSSLAMRRRSSLARAFLLFLAVATMMFAKSAKSRVALVCLVIIAIIRCMLNVRTKRDTLWVSTLRPSRDHDETSTISSASVVRVEP